MPQCESNIFRILQIKQTTLPATMGKILQKKKNRSGLSKARPKDNRRKSGSRKINMLGNAIIAENWYGKISQGITMPRI